MKQKNAKYNNKGSNAASKAAATTAPVATAVKAIPRWVFIPIVIIIAVIPLISIIHNYDCGLENFEWFSYDGNIDDTFLYYKSFFLRIVGALVLVVLAVLATKHDRDFLSEKRNIPPVIAMGVFGLMTLVSSILSEHKSDAFLGGVEEFEGCFILLTYVVSFYLAFGYVKTIKVIKFILDALLIGGFIIGLLGFLQALGYDWMQSDIAKNFLTLEIRDQIDMSTFQVGSAFAERTAYATLYNPNYMGSYVVLVFPYTAYLTIFGDRIYRKVFALITSGMLLVSLWFSNSFTGLIALGFAVLIAVILIMPLIKKIFRIIIICVAVAGAIVAVNIPSIRAEIDRQFLMATPSEEETAIRIDNMVTHKDHIDIYLSDDRKMKLQLNTDALSDPLWAFNFQIDQLVTLTDDKGNPISYSVGEDGRATINQEGYPAYVIYTGMATDESEEAQTEENNFGYTSLLYLEDAPGSFRFLFDGKRIKCINDFDRVADMTYIDKWGFKNNKDFASGRGYIWARTFPLMVKTLFTGYGPDNYVYYYPNFDYVGKGYGDYTNMTTSKPHNIFMQMWVQEGFIVVAAMLFLYILFMIRAFKLCYGKNRLKMTKGTTAFGVVIATAVASSGFMFVGIANDSLVGITSIYWIMLGVGYAAESMCFKQQKELIENA